MPSEASIKKAFSKKLKKRGFLHFRVDTDGWPDWFVMGPNGSSGFIEFKSDTGKIRENQKVRIKWLSENGYKVFVLRSSSEEVVNEFIKNLVGSSAPVSD